MGKRVKGVLKGCRVPGTAKNGYRDVWDMGRAATAKRISKVRGPNRPGI